MVRLRWLVWLALAGCGDREPPRSITPEAAVKLDLDQLRQLIRGELATLNATTAQDLIPGSPPRALEPGAPAPVPYTSGRSLIVPLLLARGDLRVPTELGLRFTVAVDPSSKLSITSRPSRDDLVTVTRLVIDGESRVLTAAATALDTAGVVSPGASWASALHAIHLDPQLPAAQFAGSAMWSLMFEPYDETTGGWTLVLVDARTFAAIRVQGGRRR